MSNIREYSKLLRKSLYEGEVVKTKQERQRRMKEELAGNRYPELTANEQQQQAKLWADFIKHFQEYCEQALKGYDNNISLYKTLYIEQKRLNDALQLNTALSSLISFAVDKLYIRPLFHAAIVKWSNLANVTVTVPTLYYHVDFTDEQQHKLGVTSFAKSVRRADGTEFTKDEQFLIQQIFSTELLVDWLDKCGYQVDNPKAPVNIRKKDDKSLLTKEIFETLRHDLDHGLDNYINSFLEVPVLNVSP